MAEAISHPLLALIRDRGLLDDLQSEEISQEIQRSGKPVAQVIEDYGLLDIDSILQIVADHLGTMVVSIDPDQMGPDVISAVTPETARMYQVVPVAVYGDTVQLAMVDPLNPQIVDEIGFTLKLTPQLVVAHPAEILKALEKFYPAQADLGYAQLLKELGEDTEAVKDADEVKAGTLKIDDLANDIPVVKFVNLVLMQAVQDRASDIHFEPFEDEFKIRYRVDGALYEMAPPPKHLATPVDRKSVV